MITGDLVLTLAYSFPRVKPSVPVLSVQGPVLNRFINMVGGNIGGLGQISNGPGQLQDAIVSPGAELQVGHRSIQNTLRRII